MTAIDAPVIVVDQNGHTLSTSFPAGAGPTPPAEQPHAQAYAAPAQPPSEAQPQAEAKAPANPPAYSNPAPDPQPPTSHPAPAPAPAPDTGSSTGGSGHGLGIVYSPYHNDGNCKDTSAIQKDFAQINGYSMLRLEGTDCSQIANVKDMCKQKGMKMMVGVYNIADAGSEVGSLIAQVGGDWDLIDTVSVGNEEVNSKGAGQIPAVLSALGTARSLLKATPFSGHVVTVDTFNALQQHPELCHASDYAAANAHPFFDPTTSAGQAGDWVKKTAADVKSACGGKRTVITESGWPSNGSPNGNALPGQAQQKTALSGIKGAFASDMFLLGAYNDHWKKNSPGQFGCEQWYGIYGNSPSS